MQISTENQNVEFKETWRDEYLKWICGFANAQGGRLYIGIDDKGTVCGVKDCKKLLEDIPNKVRDTMGLVVDVNKKSNGVLDYIEIVVAPSSFPISYHGEFHYRSGSTKQQLTGFALTEFIMRKTGIRWEDVAVENISVEDLDDESFKIFRREALRRKRMTADELDITNAELLEKLHLVTSEGKLKRSAVLLFYRDPSIVQTGTLVQIGKFGDGPDLLYQDFLEGSLLSTADKVVDLIFLKYLKAKVTFEHDRRLETYPFARDAVREAVYNALIHNCYMFGVPIQIRISDNELIISNQCILPDGWTVESLFIKHDSQPYNHNIANVFYRAGYIEHWGRGIEKICNACDELGAERPVYELIGHGLRVYFKALQSAKIETSKVSNGTLNDTLDCALAIKIVDALSQNPQLTMEQLAVQLAVSKRTISRQTQFLQEKNVIKRIGGKRFGQWKIGNIDGTLNDTLDDIVVDTSDGTLATKIVNVLRQNPRLTMEELAVQLAVSKRTISRQIQILQEKNIIKRTGGKRFGRWEIAHN